MFLILLKTLCWLDPFFCSLTIFLDQLVTLFSLVRYSLHRNTVQYGLKICLYLKCINIDKIIEQMMLDLNYLITSLF